MTRSPASRRPVLPPRLKPIGIVRSRFSTKFSAPHQPESSDESTNLIELLPRRNFEQALKDLAGFSHIWLVWWFHQNRDWKPLVRPPRGGSTKRGVFATRSPHRPNPIGLTVVSLLGVHGRVLTIGACDLLDGTPILDLKPYIAEIDSLPHAAPGWLQSIPSEPRYSVTLSPRARAQAAWLLENFNIDFVTRAEHLLALDPSPHRTRRIVKTNDGFRMGCGGWRVYFGVEGTVVQIERLSSGYLESYLKDPSLTKIPDREAQIAFRQRWEER